MRKIIKQVSVNSALINQQLNVQCECTDMDIERDILQLGVTMDICKKIASGLSNMMLGTADIIDILRKEGVEADAYQVRDIMSSLGFELEFKFMPVAGLFYVSKKEKEGDNE